MKESSRKLMGSLRAQRAASAAPAEAATLTRSVRAFDFNTLPAMAEVRFAKAAGETIGLRSPFFRPVDAARCTQVRINGNWVENFASYDYLGLNQSGAVAAAVADGVANWGVSATASRLVGGDRRFHTELEHEIARFLGTQAAIVLVSGYATNVAAIKTVMGPGDLVLVDALAHNSIYEGILSSGAERLSFPHNDWAWVDQKLATTRHQYRNVLIAIEGLYSMDGDTPDLQKFVDLKARHDAWLMVDEAHSLGVLGATGHGICEQSGIDPAQIEILMGTLSKTLCSCGGYIAGSSALIELLRYKAPGFVYSVGLSAPNAFAARAALGILNDSVAYTDRLRSLARHFRGQSQAAGLDCGLSEGHAVAPVIIGDSVRATWISDRLLDQGFNVLPIIAPAVPDKSARLRFFLTAGHTVENLDRVIAATAALADQARGLSIMELGSAVRSDPVSS